MAAECVELASQVQQASLRTGISRPSWTTGGRLIRRAGRVTPGALLMVAVLALIMAPMLLTSRSFASDWPNHLWLVWQQSLNTSALGHPSLFFQSAFGAFYPWFAFNGGTLYATTGALAAL